MTYTNTPAVVSQQTTSYSSGNIPYTSIALLENIPHSAQLEVERIFVVDRDGSAATLLAFLADTAVTTAQKKAVFIIPISRCTLNTATKNISAINLPASGDVYNYVITTPTPTTYTIKVPILSSSTVTVRRKTVSNEPLVNWVSGSRLTSKQLNLSTTQSLYLIQEALENIGTSLTIQTTQITATSLAVDAVNTINILNGAVTSAKIADGTIVNADINASAGIVDTKLATIATSGKVSNSATTATTSTTAATIALRDSNGVVPSAFIQTGTGATARTVDDKLKETVSVKDFGAIGDNVTDDTAAINAAIAFCNTNSQTLFIPRGNYKITSNITVPIAPNTQRSFGIIGEGKHFEQSVLRFTGASVTTGLTLQSPVATYQYRGLFSNFMLYFSGGATGGMTISYAHHPEINSISVYNTIGGAGSPGLTLDNCNAPRVSNCLMLGCGSSTKGAMYLNKCTVAYVDCNYLSGQVFAGIQVERGTATLQSNAIESAGYLILAGEESESTFSVSVFAFGNNLENPTGSYIRLGYGLSGSAYVRNSTFKNNSGSPSGSTSILYDVDATRCYAIDFDNNYIYGLSTGTARYRFSSTVLPFSINNNAHQVGVNTNVPWLVVNGVHRKHVGPQTTDFSSNNNRGGLTSYSFLNPPATTINNGGSYPNQGGILTCLTVHPATATTFTHTDVVPPQFSSHMMPMTIIASNAYVTLKHNHTTDKGGFFLIGGVNLTLTNQFAYSFVWNSVSEQWTQI